MNHTTTAGHLGADPEVRFTSSGQKVTTLRIGARARRSGKDETIWWRVTIWGELFDKMIPYLKKGSAVIVSGEMNKPEIFTDREGKAQVSMSMTASDLQFSPFGKPDQGSETRGYGQQNETAYSNTETATQGFSYGSAQHASQGMSQGQGKATATFTDDEIPF